MLPKFLFRLLAKHYRSPKGILGRYVGQKMDSMNNKQNDWVLSLLNLRPADRVLELGFGTGKTLKKVSKIVTTGRIYGVDSSETMYAAASRLLDKEISSGIVTLYKGDAEYLPDIRASITKIFAVHVVYFWKDLGEVFSQLFRLAAKNCLLAIYFVSPTISPTTVFREYSKDEITRVLSLVGFKKADVKYRKFGKQNGICILVRK